MIRSLVNVLVAAALAAVLLALPRDAAAAGECEVRGEHYVLTSEGPEAEAQEFVRLLEAAWPQLAAFFGAQPKLGAGERLRVRFFETEAAMGAAIVAAGGVRPQGAGGYYCPAARTSYAFRQPTRWYTRTLLLHEAVHQFHLLGAGAKVRPSHQSWWQEGLAEHLSHHTWDGTELRLGVVPPVSLEDRPAAALRALEAAPSAPERVVDEPIVDRPAAMHLVRFLATSEGGRPVAKWRELARELDRGVLVPGRDVARASGAGKAFADRYLAWLRGAQQPLVCAFVEWDALGADAVRGEGATTVVCRTRAAATSIEATVSPCAPEKPFRVGALLEFTDPRSYVVAYVAAPGRAFVSRLVDGAWKTLHDAELPAAAGPAPWRISAVRHAGSVTFRVGDCDVFALDAPYAGPLGLCVDGCAAEFRSIRIR